MKRNEKTDLIMFKKNGGGTFRLPSGKIVKPNETFKATMDEIPQAFRDQVIPLNQEDVVGTKEPAKKPEYKKEDAELFRIVDDQGPVNDKNYTEEQANKILEDGLEKEEKSGGWCNLVDPFGEYFNSKSLRSDEAEEILALEMDKEPAELVNIVDEQGKVVNEQPLTEEDADKMIKELS